MRVLYLTCLLLCYLGVIIFPAVGNSAQARSTDSSTMRSTNELVVDMARLIRRNAHFTGTTTAFQFDAYADTTAGLKLYIGEQFNVLGTINDKQWYYIDFNQPIQASQLRITRRKKYFVIDAAKGITKKIKLQKRTGEQRERSARLLIPVLDRRGKRKITANFEQLHAELAAIINQLVSSSTSFR